MEAEQKELFERLINVINVNTNWIGRTNREVRNQITNGGSEIKELNNQIKHATNTLSINISDLTKAINKHSISNNKVSRWMVALTFVLAVATVILAIASLNYSSH